MLSTAPRLRSFSLASWSSSKLCVMLHSCRKHARAGSGQSAAEHTFQRLLIGYIQYATVVYPCSKGSAGCVLVLCFSITDTVCACKLPCHSPTELLSHGWAAFLTRTERQAKMSRCGISLVRVKLSRNRGGLGLISFLLFNGDNKPQTDIHDAPLPFAILQRFTHVRHRPAV